MIVVFLGPPGAGKGTQCKLLVDRYGLHHLSSGDILRHERKEGTVLGQKAQSYMDSGQLVPDDLIVAMMMKKFSQYDDQAGFILDGFPRTLGQAKELDEAFATASRRIDLVLNLQVDDNKLEERITGRRSCPQCGTAYHVTFNPPQQDNVCDEDGETLTQRPDDTADVVRNRIKAYHDQTAPLVSYYQAQGNVQNLDGNAEISKVSRALYQVADTVAGGA